MMSGYARAGVLVLAAGLIGGGNLAEAHHSIAMFDQTAKMTLRGVVSSFEWTNPHSHIEIDVPDPNGTDVHWTIELGSPSILMQSGWKFNVLKAGDRVTVEVSPLRNGSPGGFLEYVELPDGRSLGNGPGRGPSGSAGR